MISLEIGETMVELSVAVLEASAGDRMGGQVDRRVQGGGRGGEGKRGGDEGGVGGGVGGGWGDGVGEGGGRSAVGECADGGWV